MSFWNKATQEQKLAQIDGGIECGMNTSQIAANLGSTRVAVRDFAYRHGRSFPGNSGQAIGRNSRAYAVERTKCEIFKRNTSRFGSPHEDAFSIFDNHSEAFELEWPA